MFIHSRFTVIDDKQLHLRGIKDALDLLRLDCHTKLYDVEEVAHWEAIPGTRILFIDKNLQEGVTMGSSKVEPFAAIAEVIQKLIHPDSGPFGLVLWAEEPEIEELKAFLFDRFNDQERRYLPVFFAALRKADYIDVLTGTPRSEAHVQQLKDDVYQILNGNPQMRALFAWEADVMAASDAVLRSLVDLVPLEKRRSDEFAQELGKVFYRVSQAGAGRERAIENPRESINSVLVPILADRVAEHDPEGDAGDRWREALVEPAQAENKAPVDVQAAVNTAIHLSFAKANRSAPILPIDLGAVILNPFQNDDALQANFGVSKEQILRDIFNASNASEAELASCKLCLVQIGASCDHAQPKKGPLLYLLGLMWPFTNPDGSATDDARLHKNKKMAAEGEWQSPIISVAADKPGRLSFFFNLSLTETRELVNEKNWQPAFRLREELVSQLTQEYARHVSRPGIVELR